MTAAPPPPAMPRPCKLAPRQLEANRRNAQKSTGPRSQAGKQTCRLNARRHDLTGQVSILPDTERAAIETFCKGIIASLAPGSDYEMQLARGIADAQWRLNRARAVEDNFFAIHIADFADHPVAGGNTQIADAVHQAQAFFNHSDDFNRLTLYEQRIQRAMAKNIQLLSEAKQQRLAAKAQAAEAQAPEAQMKATSNNALAEAEATPSEAKANNGSVFSIDPSTPPDAPRPRLVSTPDEPCTAGRSSNI